MTPISSILLGAGSRGAVYARWAKAHPDRVRVVGVADPRPHARDTIARALGIPPTHVVADWRELADRPRFADAAIIATPDAIHAEPAIALADRGYHLLLEKPMAPSATDCRRIADAVTRAGVLLAVCHVLRYTRYTEALTQIVRSGRLGAIVSLQHLEPVGYWHQAHAFVRGNWNHEARSAPMLLAKSSHDLDWIRYVIGAPCLQVSSFGALAHFRPDQAPPGAAVRCLDCASAIEARCPYSAIKIYLGRLRAGHTGWPVDVLTHDLTEAGVTEALRTGPYGRCVYACDNDVVDHQVVNLRFANGATAAFTMTGFTRHRDRETRIFGTHAELFGNGRMIEVHDFLTDRTERVDVHATSDGTVLSGHGGGDDRLMDAFVAAIETGDASRISSGARESLESHLMVFAAEQARHTGRVVDVSV